MANRRMVNLLAKGSQSTQMSQPCIEQLAAFVETDLVDPRYFSAANVKNRLESYFQMIEQKRGGASRGVAA